MEKRLGISVYLVLCLISGHASGRSVRAAELGSKFAGGGYSYTSLVSSPQRGRRAPARRCTPDLRHVPTPLTAVTYTGTFVYTEAGLNSRATLSVRDNQTFEITMQDGSGTAFDGELYAVTNCGETTVVMRLNDRRRGGPASVRHVSARACRRGNDFSLTSLGGTFSFQTEGPATGGTPFEWGRCKS
jgi:hypothetical protein